MYLPIFYHDPLDGGALIEGAEGYRNPRSGFLYPLRGGMPVFLPAGSVVGPNLRYQALYDRFALLQDLSSRVDAWLGGAGGGKERKSYLELLELRDEAAFLEVSVGGGANWRYLNRRLHFYGLDLSAGMLACCRRRAYRLKLRSRLCQGLAEHLPYPNSSFDCVLHAGGIHCFSDPAAALREMVRVAKPGSRLVIADETEATARRKAESLFGKSFYKDRPRKIEPLAGLLPAGMREVQEREICAGAMYVLTFRKPNG